MKINIINIGLMLASGMLAMAFPFYLFLFSYAVLGPLHYLTEISWLHERKYFLKRRVLVWPLILVGGLATVASLAQMHGDAGGLEVLTVMALIFAAFAIRTTAADPRMIAALVIGMGIALLAPPEILILLGLLLPTLIHVFVFTLLFILAGSLKSRSLSGYASLAVFVVTSMVLLLWHPVLLDSGRVTSYERGSYGTFDTDNAASGFIGLNYLLLRLSGAGMPQFTHGICQVPIEINDYLYNNPAARTLMAFIAFAYTYHYLNWFSKTSVIGWHRASPRRIAMIVTIWLVSLGLYAINYVLGFRWLFLLSFLHVLLEFPLNCITFAGIVRAFRSMGRGHGQRIA